jgi:hypothetical protein
VWAQQLSHTEALLAARYVLHEMNRFPSWIFDLLIAHPRALDDVMHAEIRWEFNLTDCDRATPVHHMVAQLRYCSQEKLRDRYTPYILHLLLGHEPWRDETLENALFIVLQSDELNITRNLSELVSIRKRNAPDLLIYIA